MCVLQIGVWKQVQGQRALQISMLNEKYLETTGTEHLTDQHKMIRNNAVLKIEINGE